MKIGIKVLGVILLTVLGCSSFEQDYQGKVDSTAYENVAVRFFVDSLLNKRNLFITDESLFLAIGRTIPFMDSSMYTNGLFSQEKIFYDSYSTLLTLPYKDSTEYEFLESDEIAILHLLSKDYKSKLQDLDTIQLLSVDSFNEMSWDSYVSNFDNMENSLYLFVHKYIEAKNIAYVQLEFRDVDYEDMYFLHNFYIKIDTLKSVLDWWIEY